jgi:microcystin-dependent protein
MASTYSDLKIELIGTGEQVGTWGTTTNTNLGTAIEEAITGSADVTFSSADLTLTLTNTNASQTARHLRLRLTGTSGGARNLTVPDIQKNYVIKNELDDAVTVKNSTGATVTIQSGTSSYVFSTGAGVEEVISTSLFIPSGIITMWSGSIATIPLTWALCDGTNGTPDLTEKFVVGANQSGGTFAQGEEGGYADSIIPTHTHGATSTDSGHVHGLRYRAVGADPAGSGLSVTSASNAFTGAVSYNYNSSDRMSDSGAASITTTIASTGESATNKNLPPWFALAYIMKL